MQSLKSKTLSGPGLPSMTWSYGYASTGSWAPCNACSSTKTVQVTDARGYVTRFLYGTLFQVNEGQLLQQDQGWNGSTALRSTTYSYHPPAGAAYPEPIGSNPLEVADYLASRHRPQKQRSTAQQGVNFSWLANSFDVFARPLSVTRSSGLGQSRTETTAYVDNLSKWVMGQVATVTDGATGTVMSQTNYHPSTGLPLNSWRFGKLQASYTFNGDGTLATVKDGANQTTTYSNYKRGLAQSVGYADGTGESAVVNDLGLISSVTSAAGYTTGYGYDAIGRLHRITPPTGDPVAYNSTSIVFEPVGWDEYGLAAGHWRQTISRGNARTVNYFDAFWRPLMQRSYDAADEGTTRKVTVRAFDPDGRATFESYPQRDIASVGSTPAGKRSYFDALGRNYRVETDSELGVLVSTSEFLGGFQTRTTNPRGKATTQRFWALDKPDETQLAGASAPAGVNVSVGRDGYGKPVSITRSGLYNGQNVSVTRRYVYDSGQRLCKSIEPELGATVQDYDLAGNIAWRAPGQNLPNTGSCDTAGVTAAAKISHSYTARNLLQNSSHGDSSPGIARTYTPDGLLKTIASNGSTWTYGYNALRLLSSETLNYGGQNYALGWGFDANGNTSAITYPGGGTVAFNPNALGQPRQVGAFASAVSHHPNGVVAGYTLGNGIVHSLSQNARGLPLQNRDAGVMQDLYTYDSNGNVTAIADQQENLFNRALGYDDLDRLTSASAPSVWGTASYGYDPVDNLRTAVVGSRNSTLNYDTATNRLSSVVTNGSSTAYGYDALGNLRSKGLQTLGFDIANRLTSASVGGSYVYDGLGRRIKVVSTDGSTRIQVYSRAGQLVWATSSGGPRPASTTAYTYLGGKQIAETSNGVTQYVHTDALGSPVAHTGSNGALLNRTRFEPFGYTAQGTKPGPATSVIGFTGHVNDPETDLVYMQQRYYDPIAGRFLSIDPVVTDANTGSSFNRYEYGNSNPYGFIDPTGMAAEDPKPVLVEVTGSRIPRESGVWVVAMPNPQREGSGAGSSVGMPSSGGATPRVGTPSPGLNSSQSLVNPSTIVAKEAIPLTKARFGHTFTTHGQEATEFLTKRAAGSGKPMGQFLDDQAAARLIQQNLGNLKSGAISVPISRDFPARVVMPDGTFAPASTIRLVPGGGGVKTAYPEL
ncbi:MAG: RHS repeat-associated core domain-containing protein [Burkholderiaceae bacterium]|nr:RHS repeat-associated core domain-containing protein [Burkholderiaceae bacterium]